MASRAAYSSRTRLAERLTGPIIRNRLFFSSSLHYLRFNSGSTPLSTVPTALEKVGDFSKTLIRETTGLPVPAVVFNPYNVVQLRSGSFPAAALSECHRRE